MFLLDSCLIFATNKCTMHIGMIAGASGEHAKHAPEWTGRKEFAHEVFEHPRHHRPGDRSAPRAATPPAPCASHACAVVCFPQSPCAPSSRSTAVSPTPTKATAPIARLWPACWEWSPTTSAFATRSHWPRRRGSPLRLPPATTIPTSTTPTPWTSRWWTQRAAPHPCAARASAAALP